MRLGRGGDARRVGPHLGGEEREEAQPLRGIEPRIAVEQLAGDGDARGFAAARDQRPRQLLDVIARVGAEQRLGQQRTALLGDRAQQLLEKRDVQSAALPPWTKHDDSAAAVAGDCSTSAHAIAMRG